MARSKKEVKLSDLIPAVQGEEVTVPATQPQPEPVNIAQIVEVYDESGNTVKSFSIKDGEDYVDQAKKFAVEKGFTIGFTIK